MINLNFKFATDHSKTPFPKEILEDRLIELRRPVFDSLFCEMACDNDDHQDFQNEIEVTLGEDHQTEAGSSFVIKKICCQKFDQKIKKRLA